MNQLQLFNSDEFGKVRVVVIDGEPWFVGKDICRALGYAEPRKMVAYHVDDEDKKGSKTDTPSGKQATILVNESGLYSLILSSKKPKVRDFKRWITRDVLPSIRKTGAYVTDKRRNLDWQQHRQAAIDSTKAVNSAGAGYEYRYCRWSLLLLRGLTFRAATMAAVKAIRRLWLRLSKFFGWRVGSCGSREGAISL